MPGDVSLQINMGLVQCDDRPQAPFHGGERWPDLGRVIAEANRTIMRRIERKIGF
jgi:hypothetical protein